MQCNITKPPPPSRHTGTPHPKCACSFNRPKCSSLNQIRASTELFIHKFLIVMFTPIPQFSAFELPNDNPPKKLQPPTPNHHKKDLSLQPQFIKTKKITLDQPATTNSTQLPHTHTQVVIFSSLPAVVQWLSLLHNFIQLSLNSGSAQVQTLCRRFAMVRISDNGPGWK